MKSNLVTVTCDCLVALYLLCYWDKDYILSTALPKILIQPLSMIKVCWLFLFNMTGNTHHLYFRENSCLLEAFKLRKPANDNYKGI